MEYKLFNGDCFEKLKGLPDNSVDSIVTDPPYGLSKDPNMVDVLEAWMNGLEYKHGHKGFMGKEWDSFVPGPNVWKECLRVLKPGGHIVAFFGTRTYDLGVLAIRMAGFEVRDQLAWVYGCLSEDTEIATPFGVKPYNTIKTGDLVLCYDKYKKEYSYQPVEEVYEYDIKDTAYRIQSDNTDQIVSRNHRCLVERNGREVFLFAEELSSQENIPFLEDLSTLQTTLSNSFEGASNQKQNLLQNMQGIINWNQKFWWETTRRAFWYGTSSLQSLWNYIFPKQKAFGTCENSSMFLSMQWCHSWGGVETTCTQRQEKLEARIRKIISRKNDGGIESKLERWGDIQKTKRELQGGEIHSLSKRILGNVTKRWLYNGTSFGDGANFGEDFEKNRSSSSYKSQPTGQQNRKFDVVCEQQRSQKIREWWGHKTTLATITPFEYEGKIWCVKVPTGSFVAVRNGKAFTTGNSGFPKSLDVSMAIDKSFGAEREVVGKRKHPTLKDTNKTEESANAAHGGNTWSREWDITEPATDPAKQWEGWGTALKPAYEPIVLARKPLIGTVVENVLEHGTGAINIDDCRVSADGEMIEQSGEKVDIDRGKCAEGYDRPNSTMFRTGKPKERGGPSNSQGRFPANLIHDGSEEVVELFPYTKSGTITPDQQAKGGFAGSGAGIIYGSAERGGVNGFEGNEGSASRFFYCAKASKSDRDEGLHNFQEKQASGLPLRSKDLQSNGEGLDGTKTFRETTRKNIHPTVKPTELMRYLCRLITPPNGTVLDPFMGSGSTGKAAMYEGFNFIGIELDPHYLEISEARIKFAIVDRTNNPSKKVAKSDKVVYNDQNQDDNLGKFFG
jgi:DNA modification methylase